LIRRLFTRGTGADLDLVEVRRIVDYAVGNTLPDLTMLLRVPLAISEQRRARRQAAAPERDRFEESDRGFFQRVEEGYENLGMSEGDRVRTIDATKSIDEVADAIWLFVKPLFEQRTIQGEVACKSVGEEGRGRE
jgi:dTMP kinase